MRLVAVRAWLRPQPVAWFAAFVVLWIAFGTSGTIYQVSRTGYGVMFFVGLLVALPLAMIVRRPLPGLVIAVLAAFLLSVTVPLKPQHGSWDWLVIHGLVIFALLFASCLRERPSRAFAGWLITAWLYYVGVPDDVRAGWIVAVTMIAVVGLLLGRLINTRRELEVQEEVSSAEKALRVVLQERARIARDLHDIVAHHMSLVVVQAETAGFRVPDLSEAARAELLSIGETARSALIETRALLNVLRQEDQGAPNAPQPGLQQLPDLVDGARRAGLEVQARITGDLGALAGGAALAAYRIAQEALANASRHAPGAPVRFEVDSTADGVRLLVVNPLTGEGSAEAGLGTGPGAEAGPGAGPRAGARTGTGAGAGAGADKMVGHGITGMRERAAAAGGQVTIGPTSERGSQQFAVHLFLPSTDASTSNTDATNTDATNTNTTNTNASTNASREAG